MTYLSFVYDMSPKGCKRGLKVMLLEYKVQKQYVTSQIEALTMKNLPKICLPMLLICCNVGLQLVYTESPTSNISDHRDAKNDNETWNFPEDWVNHGNDDKVC